jgi:hypothetical protein
MIEERPEPGRCGGCGVIVDGGTAGCRATFDCLALPAPPVNPLIGWRRLLVDTYSLQHPDAFCISATSLAAHLTGLGWILEYGGDAATGSEQLRRWLNGKPDLVKPPLPSSYGEVRIDALLAARSPDEIAAAVRRWAQGTWQAYAALHPIAREWIARALAYRGHAR